MKQKLLKLNAVLLMIGLALNVLQAQTSLNLKLTGGTKITYLLSGIRKLTFSGTGNMTVSKTNNITDNYVLSSVRYLNFADTSDGIIVGKLVKGDLRIFPNPVANVLHLEFAESANQTATVELLSMDGRVLYSTKLSYSNHLEVNVSQFRRGIYYCRVNNGVGIETTKFIKK